MSLMDSLGLDNVEADPNALPDGKWAGVVYKSEYVYVKKNDSVAHVITYRVTEGTRKGAERQEWFTLGTAPKNAAGEPTTNVAEIASYTPSMTEQQKPWYKKRFVDLGIAEDEVTKTNPQDLVGKNVTFGTKKNGSYININFVELRDVNAAAEANASGGAVSGLL